ncbi:MAG TPA: hypothetical protein PKY30_18420 [Myxococcota bacterium]|nr:hypothetical protein [Myxococcota bacterium]HNH49026.1 hypothetical protein [Myxococcota bacterium]
MFNAISTVPSGPGAGDFDEYILSGAELEHLGPFIQDLVVHVDGSTFTPNFTYDVQLQYRYRSAWISTPLLSLQSATGYVISATPFTDRSKFGMELRIVLRTQVSTYAGGPQRGTLSLTVAARLLS